MRPATAGPGRGVGGISPVLAVVAPTRRRWAIIDLVGNSNYISVYYKRDLQGSGGRGRCRLVRLADVEKVWADAAHASRRIVLTR
jgi:hypothetical protein